MEVEGSDLVDFIPKQTRHVGESSYPNKSRNEISELMHVDLVAYRAHHPPPGGTDTSSSTTVDQLGITSPLSELEISEKPDFIKRIFEKKQKKITHKEKEKEFFDIKNLSHPVGNGTDQRT